MLRNAGGRVTDQALQALVLSVNLLGVNRVLVVPHTRCAMVTATEAELAEQVSRASGRDASWQTFDVVQDQESALRYDVQRVRDHPLMPESIAVGGFLYDVDTGRLTQLF